MSTVSAGDIDGFASRGQARGFGLRGRTNGFISHGSRCPPSMSTVSPRGCNGFASPRQRFRLSRLTVSALAAHGFALRAEPHGFGSHAARVLSRVAGARFRVSRSAPARLGRGFIAPYSVVALHRMWHRHAVPRSVQQMRYTGCGTDALYRVARQAASLRHKPRQGERS